MKLFVIEGLDGSGKSTQLDLLKNFLKDKGYDYEFLHFPRTETPYFGELIARFLRGEFGNLPDVDPYLVAILYAGDRRDASLMIREWLEEGKVVLLDRYTYSNIAYQCAKIDDQVRQKKLMKWILDLEFEHFGIPRPDVNFFLDVPFEFTELKLSSLRSGDDRGYLNGNIDIHERNLEFQRKVRNIYLKISQSDKHLVTVNCCDRYGKMKSPEEISELIISMITTRNLI
jgi:dTMP kinase